MQRRVSDNPINNIKSIFFIYLFVKYKLCNLLVIVVKVALLTSINFKPSNFKYRLVLSTLIYLIFTIFYLAYGFYPSSILTLIPSFGLYLYFVTYDKVNLIEKTGIIYSVIVVFYGLLLTIIVYSVKTPFFSTILIKAGFEEIIFRLCMMGLLKHYVDFDDFFKMGVILVLNALFFSSLHVQYSDIWDYSTIFLQGLNYGIIYIGLGIVPSIVSHTIWNLYYPNINPQLPILIFSIARIYYSIVSKQRKERATRMGYLR